MPEPKSLVINTGPTFALIAATGDLKLLDILYERVVMPLEVCQELLVGGSSGFGIEAFEKASWIEKQETPQEISPLLANSLDSGEAAVIQLALTEGI